MHSSVYVYVNVRMLFIWKRVACKERTNTRKKIEHTQGVRYVWAFFSFSAELSAHDVKTTLRNEIECYALLCCNVGCITSCNAGVILTVNRRRLEYCVQNKTKLVLYKSFKATTLTSCGSNRFLYRLQLQLMKKEKLKRCWFLNLKHCRKCSFPAFFDISFVWLVICNSLYWHFIDYVQFHNLISITSTLYICQYILFLSIQDFTVVNSTVCWVLKNYLKRESEEVPNNTATIIKCKYIKIIFNLKRKNDQCGVTSIN